MHVLTTTLHRALRSDRLVKVFVADSVEPSLVQQTVLETASDYFVKALRPASFGEGTIGILRFPEDDVDVWKVLQYWMFKRSLPDDLGVPQTEKGYCDLLVSCWAHGDKYNMPTFQDIIMVKLLCALENTIICLEQAKVAFGTTAPGSKVRAIFAEEVVYLMKTASGPVAYDDLELFDGIAGFTGALLVALDTWAQANGVSRRVGYTSRGNTRDRWKAFMVGGERSQQWVDDRLTSELKIEGQKGERVGKMNLGFAP